MGSSFRKDDRIKSARKNIAMADEVEDSVEEELRGLRVEISDGGEKGLEVWRERSPGPSSTVALRMVMTLYWAKRFVSVDSLGQFLR